MKMDYVDKNYEYYIQADLNQFIGEYVAIHNNKIQFHHKDLKKVYQYMKSNYPEVVPFITQVVSGQAMIL